MNAILALVGALGLVCQAVATDFLDHGQLLAGVEDPEFFEQNVPILDLPDQQIQDVYYYRWQSYREHLFYTGAQYGYLSTEFLGAVGYGGPYGGIVAAAGHHINEGRWLRDRKPGQDLVNFWLAGPGQFSKNATDDLNPDTFDWVHEYSFWAASSVWRQYLATGDLKFAVGHLDNMVKVYRGYDNHFNDTLGLYWQAPVWDATEYSAASYESSDPYHGGYGYRPTINSYQYGDALAISAIATLSGDTDLASEYANRASDLRAKVQDTLWDSGAQFFKHLARDDNPSEALLDTREIMGYIPWYFNLPEGSTYSAAFSQLKDLKGFSSPYGPTTTENRSSLFMKDASQGCCHWDGPSWPFATAQTLTAVENLLNDYPAQSYITSTDYVDMLRIYAATQYKAGQPYVAEAHDAYLDNWMYDSECHSEDYNHSTFIDNVIAGLLGLRAQANDTLLVSPLAPPSWNYFGLENTAYHGHNVTVLWDSNGSHYNQGQGLQVWVDGQLAGNRTDLGPVMVQVGEANEQPVDTAVNIAANTLQTSQGPQPNASYTSTAGGCTNDNVWHVVDGTVYRLGIPQNSRWTTYQSPNSQDWFSLDLRRRQAISDVRLYFWDDNGGVRLPSMYDLQYWTGSDWATIPGQQRTGTLANNARIQIMFPQITTSQLRVVAPNGGNGTGWGLSEFEVWTPPVFQISNVNSGKLMGVKDESTANSANIQQFENNGSPDHLWEFAMYPGGYVKIQNVNSRKLLAVSDASTADSAILQQYDDNGSQDHLWRLEDTGNAQFLIRNKNSGLVAGVDGESLNNSANVAQFVANGTKGHLWTLLASVPASRSGIPCDL